MLPVRRMAAEHSDGHGGAGDASARSTRSRGRGRPAPSPPPAREWWELNEQGTILRGERTGTTLRLGDQIWVRVQRVDSSRGRVDLTLAGELGSLENGQEQDKRKIGAGDVASNRYASLSLRADRAARVRVGAAAAPR